MIPTAAGVGIAGGFDESLRPRCRCGVNGISSVDASPESSGGTFLFRDTTVDGCDGRGPIPFALSAMALSLADLRVAI